MQQQTPQHHDIDLDSYTDLSVGEILRRTRLYYGQSLNDVEINLRIRASQLDLLEQNHIAHLPGRVYAIGFVRAYSEYLGLDGDKMVHLFKAQSVGKKWRPKLSFPEISIENATPQLPLIFASLIGSIVIIAVLSMTYTPSHHELIIPPVPEALKTRRAEIMNPVQKIIDGEEGEEPTATTSTSVISLRMTEDSWIEVKNQTGQRLVSRIFKAGETYNIPAAQNDLTLSTGNAGGVDVYIEGKKAQTLGQKAQVRRNIPLEVENFISE